MRSGGRSAARVPLRSVEVMTTTTHRTPTSTTPTPLGRAARLLRHPLGWLAAGLVAVGALSTFAGAAPVVALLGTAGAVVAYWAIMRFVARRPTPELTGAGLGRNLATGSGIGAAFLLGSVAVITVLGGYTFTTTGAVGVGALPGLVVVAVTGAVTEELLFRGLIFQAVEALRGPRVALVVSALLFGLAHLANPGASLWSSVAIAVEAGGLLGAAFWWRRNLWFVTALHAVWNGLEQLIGIQVSGHTAPSLLLTHADGPMLLTGGAFGLEASIVPIVASVALSVVLLRRRTRTV